MEMIARLFSRNYLLLANLACFVGFCCQFGSVLHTYLHPTQPIITVTERNLEDSTFPIIFKICFDPSFNTSEEEDAGYGYYFMSGRSKYNSSVVGWAGHTAEGGVQGTVQEMVKRVNLHNPKQVIDSIYIWSMANTWIDISLDSVKLWRLNHPYNCYTLDLSMNHEVREKGIKQIFFSFPLLENTSIELKLKGTSLTSNREIKSHKFQSSGVDIKLTLGKKSLKASKMR